MTRTSAGRWSGLFVACGLLAALGGCKADGRIGPGGHTGLPTIFEVRRGPNPSDALVAIIWDKGDPPPPHGDLIFDDQLWPMKRTDHVRFVVQGGPPSDEVCNLSDQFNPLPPGHHVMRSAWRAALDLPEDGPAPPESTPVLEGPITPCPPLQ
jgi:hypothetical protein